MDVSTKFEFAFSTINNETIVNLLARLAEELRSSLKVKELVVLDFAQFKAFDELTKVQNFDQWWRNHMTINDRSNLNISNIRLCGNINQATRCLKVCS